MSTHVSTHEMRFIFQRDIRQALDHFSRLLGVRLCFLAPDGRELQVGEGKPHARFCRLVRDGLGLTDKCEACDRKGWQRAARSQESVFYRCHAGMLDGCMAVRGGGRTIGYMMIGQFRTRDVCGAAVMRRWREVRGNDDLQKAFCESPRYSKQQVNDIMGIFTVLVNFVVSQRLIAVGGVDPVQPLLTYMAEHPTETLTTGDAARLLHRSVSSLSHVFKQTMGRSFLQYQIEAKLDLADELFRDRKDITIRETAYELGFRDPYYFSRLYKKHRGYPPSEAIRQYRNTL